MYKFDSSKPGKQRSVDGFLASGPRKPHFQANPSKQAQNTIMRPRQGRIDEFSKSDGFHRQTTQRLDEVGAYTDIDEKAVLRRRPGFALKSHKKHSKRHFSWKTFMKMSLVLVVLVLGVAGFVFGKAWWNAHKVLQGGGGAVSLNKNVDPYQLKGEGDGRVNVLLMGKGGGQHQGGDLTDSIMIASIDPINKSATMLSIPRDLWVKPNGLWPMKINAVYTSAKSQALYKNPKDTTAAEKTGISSLEKVVKDYMGVPIHYYAMVDFIAFRDAVDNVGGIDITLDEPYSDPTYGDSRVKYGALKLAAGVNHVNGGMALAYARSRHGDARGDFGRGEHQQKVLMGIKDKVLTLGTFANPAKVTQLLDTFGNRVSTNFSINDIMRIYELGKQFNNSNVNNVDLAMPGSAVVTTGMIGEQSVVYPKAGVDNYDEIRSFVRNKLKDGYIIKENPSIIVLNGSTKAGAAQKRANELKGYGYNVIQVADAASKTAGSTQLVDMTNGQKKYTKRYLEQRLGTKSVTAIDGMDLTPYTADFVVIVGPEG